jgi:hypothetical protein
VNDYWDAVRCLSGLLTDRARDVGNSGVFSSTMLRNHQKLQSSSKKSTT